jgi:hypothetical protein
VNQRLGDLVHGAVAAHSHDTLATVRHGLAGEIGGMAGSIRDGQFRIGPMRGSKIAQSGKQVRIPAGRAGFGIEYEMNSHVLSLARSFGLRKAIAAQLEDAVQSG